MHIVTTTRQSIFALLTVTTLAGLPANAADPPAYMQAISGAVDSSPAETATKNVLALNAAMFGLYDAAGRVFQKNILAQHPVILGLFSAAGGRFRSNVSWLRHAQPPPHGERHENGRTGV